jgi:hypothetical protein
MQTRRHVLAVAGTLLAGCASWPRDRPAPTVGDHLQGDITVVDTTRRIRLDAPDEFMATVRNDGSDSAVALSLYWVPRPDADPAEKSHRELQAAGYDRATERIVSVPGGDRRTVTFEASFPADAAGYYVRYHVLTYGASVTNQGAAGAVRVILVDTTDMRNQRHLASKTMRFDAGERRVVTVRTRARFETFRIDAEAAEGWGDPDDGSADEATPGGASIDD